MVLLLIYIILFHSCLGDDLTEDQTHELVVFLVSYLIQVILYSSFHQLKHAFHKEYAKSVTMFSNS